MYIDSLFLVQCYFFSFDLISQFSGTLQCCEDFLERLGAGVELPEEIAGCKAVTRHCHPHVVTVPELFGDTVDRLPIQDQLVGCPCDIALVSITSHDQFAVFFREDCALSFLHHDVATAGTELVVEFNRAVCQHHLCLIVIGIIGQTELCTDVPHTDVCGSDGERLLPVVCNLKVAFAGQPDVAVFDAEANS